MSKTITLLAGGQLGVDRAVHDFVINSESTPDFAIDVYGYVPSFWTFDATKYASSYRVLSDVERIQDCDVRMMNDADALVCFRLDLRKSGRAGDTLINFVRTGEFTFVARKKPEGGGVIHEILASSTDTNHSHKPILVLWNTSPETLDAAAHQLRAFLHTHHVRKPMFTGPLPRTWEKRGLDGHALVTELLNQTFCTPDPEEVAPTPTPTNCYTAPLV